MRSPDTVAGFHVPNVNHNVRQSYGKKPVVFRAVEVARSELLCDRAIGDKGWPVAGVGAAVATRYCREGVEGLTAGDLGWLTGCVVELLSLDPVVQEFLHIHGLTSQTIRKRKRGGSR